MKLSPEKIELLAAAIVDELAEVDGVLFQSSDSDLRLAINDIITDELMIEERLDAEIHKMLQAYKYEITMGRLNYDELYRKMRSRLLAERKIIL
ncbi:DUF507 family protein [Oscillochloris sp. ZM17-4]|uniref:DUF507 family protein n=1 Tax=Oscillochloris sp. ZM17-4 TaxID=2866714 RepID=UPI001C738C1C|nr:DUF507 family protein [Oscillochloris sp. ZM17-4]MBX0327021.1 DUF507 family protein [Oscillochloris sp. ZM17-4]